MSQRKLILSMQITLDGYIAGPNDEADWIISSDDEWDDLQDDLNNTDTYLLGRKMYEVYSPYWQSVLQKADSPPIELNFAKLAAKTKHVVFTKGNFQPDWSNTTVAHDLVGDVTKLKNEPGPQIIAWGGGILAANLIDADLIDEYRFVLNPTLLTIGKSLYEHIQKRRTLQLMSSKQLSSGLVVLRYQADHS